ncbi:unnamed protein product [Phytophthora fragariaefolia]|uniref:Unnamed protein product n=1 Tax=Phytophthora fragariaefolia TaxID=1490495 RepID=A0A9W6YGA4_9STRA|nr:unnamed protein product [Phytophthora fragariaefolia]
MYKAFKLDLSPAQAKKVLARKTIRLSADQLDSGHEHMFHPENYKKLMRAKKANKGLTLALAHGEVAATYHSGLSGSGFWGNVWSGIKRGARFLRPSSNRVPLVPCHTTSKPIGQSPMRSRVLVP